MWLAAFIALVGILLVFDRVAHAGVESPPIGEVGEVGGDDEVDEASIEPVEPVEDADLVAAAIDDPGNDADDVRAATELVRLADPSWLAALAEGERLDDEVRHTRPSRLGRLDVALAWRHADRDPRTVEPYGADAVFLVATWRR